MTLESPSLSASSVTFVLNWPLLSGQEVIRKLYDRKFISPGCTGHFTVTLRSVLRSLILFGFYYWHISQVASCLPFPACLFQLETERKKNRLSRAGKKNLSSPRSCLLTTFFIFGSGLVRVCRKLLLVIISLVPLMSSISLGFFSSLSCMSNSSIISKLPMG